MSNLELEQLIQKAKNIKMTKEEKKQQRISFTYGNLKIDNPDITREQIEQVAKKMHRSWLNTICSLFVSKR